MYRFKFGNLISANRMSITGKHYFISSRYYKASSLSSNESPATSNISFAA